MNTYLVLIRGINVGGKNKISMALLKEALEEMGFLGVSTYIASGNIILTSNEASDKIKNTIEAMLPKKFTLDSTLIKVLVLSRSQLKAIITHKPAGFGEQSEKYHSDVIFLIDSTLPKALAVFSPKEGVDTIWPGKGVIYSQRLSAMRTKSRLNKIIGTSAYASMTIRTWNTVTKLSALLDAHVIKKSN